ncbi:hypothetical protein [Demequina sediminicola]|uniref:hypothetical protein n=1 Tax=Demequina sediminicola TaxID=1095026 RepID=UPI0007835071|nr:hypothetical protein [Demequina sediminicola]
MSTKDLRDRRWQLAVSDTKVSVYQTGNKWAAWVPPVLIIFVAINTYREVVTTDNIQNTALASIIWGVLLLVPAGIVYWLWGMNRRSRIVRVMNRRDTETGVTLTLRDANERRHDFVLDVDDADRIEDIITTDQGR